MNGRGVKVGNEYTSAMRKFYEQTPKAVFAAIAFSYAVHSRLEGRGINQPQIVIDELLNEWRILHENEVIPQPPPRSNPTSRAGGSGE